VDELRLKCSGRCDAAVTSRADPAVIIPIGSWRLSRLSPVSSPFSPRSGPLGESSQPDRLQPLAGVGVSLDPVDLDLTCLLRAQPPAQRRRGGGRRAACGRGRRISSL
jgi:hypothetical protein